MRLCRRDSDVDLHGRELVVLLFAKPRRAVDVGLRAQGVAVLCWGAFKTGKGDGCDGLHIQVNNEAYSIEGRVGISTTC